jgi:hypothetical protein
MKEPTIEELKEVIKLTKPSFAWMLKDIKHRADLINVGSYSDELTSAIAVGELLELIEDVEK